MTDTKKASIFSVGMIRGLIFMLIGYVVGILLVTVIRLVMGLPAILPWNSLDVGTERIRFSLIRWALMIRASAHWSFDLSGVFANGYPSFSSNNCAITLSFLRANYY